MSKVAVITVLYITSVTFLSPEQVQAVSDAMTDNQVTFIGTVSCSRCQSLEPHKGYTRWTWALHSVSEGDDIVLVSRNNIYKLQGDKNQFLKYMEDKVEVTKTLEGRPLTVQRIARPKEKAKVTPNVSSRLWLKAVARQLFYETFRRSLCFRYSNRCEQRLRWQGLW